jgi:hypothetical protein
MRLSRNLAGCLQLYGPCEMSHSETLPAHISSVLGSHDPRQMGITTWSESAHICKVKTDISAMLMDMSGPDSHTMKNWTHNGQQR